MNNPHIIQIGFDPDNCEFILMAVGQIEVMGKDCPDEVKDAWFDEHGIRVEDDMPIPAAQVGGITFDTVEEMAVWLSATLPKFWAWLVGLDNQLPSDFSVAND